MPLPDSSELLQLSEDVLHQFETMFGPHPGIRPAHAKGALVRGTFQPSADGRGLTRAPHLHRDSTPVLVRFSNSTGLPLIPDNNPNASPHGLAVRFQLADRVHTDIISHSADGFPTRTGQEFLELLRAAAASGDPSLPHPTPIEQFLGAHPAALAFVQAPRPAPSSLARLTYFGVTAVKFTSQTGAVRFGRYRIVPEAGNDSLADSASKGPDYLYEELAGRLSGGPVRFRIKAQLANDGDVTDDATVHWPDDRQVIDLGLLDLSEFVPDSAAEQQRVIFDPIPRVDGIEPSADPLLELRSAIYLISGRKRRSAPAATTAARSA